MDKQEYLGFVVILEDTKRSIEATLARISVEERPSLVRIINGLNKSIQVYREKANADRT